MSVLDTFFNLGNKATGGDPLKKSQFDYYLYWIVFLAFIGIALTYYYNFFFKGASVSTLFWALVMTVFGWFNYYALGAFRAVYENMKKLDAIKVNATSQLNPPIKEDTLDEMIAGFKNATEIKN